MTPDQAACISHQVRGKILQDLSNRIQQIRKPVIPAADSQLILHALNELEFSRTAKISRTEGCLHDGTPEESLEELIEKARRLQERLKSEEDAEKIASTQGKHIQRLVRRNQEKRELARVQAVDRQYQQVEEARLTRIRSQFDEARTRCDARRKSEQDALYHLQSTRRDELARLQQDADFESLESEERIQAIQDDIEEALLNLKDEGDKLNLMMTTLDACDSSQTLPERLSDTDAKATSAAQHQAYDKYLAISETFDSLTDQYRSGQSQLDAIGRSQNFTPAYMQARKAELEKYTAKLARLTESYGRVKADNERLKDLINIKEADRQKALAVEKSLVAKIEEASTVLEM